MSLETEPESELSSLHQVGPLFSLHQSKNSVHSANEYSFPNNSSHAFGRVLNCQLCRAIERLRGPTLWAKRPQHWLCFLLPYFQGWAGEVLGPGRRTMLSPTICLWPANRELSGFTRMCCDNSPQPAQPIHRKFDGHILLLLQVYFFKHFTSPSRVLYILRLKNSLGEPFLIIPK